MQIILALSGRKQSGKSTAVNLLHGFELVSLGLAEYARLDSEGNLVVPAAFRTGEEVVYRDGVFDINRNDPAFIGWMAENVWPFLKQYSFADALKQNVCIDVLGLTYEQCYGSDKDKNSPTHLRWEDMPGVSTDPGVLTAFSDEVKTVRGRLGQYYKIVRNSIVYHEPGPMTAREVLQFVGTEIFRKMYGNVWVDATLRKVQAEGPAIAVISDCRFPNEVEGVRRVGGKVVRFTRTPFPEDSHFSETALDPDNFDWSNFDAVIDNSDMTLRQKHEAFVSALRVLDVFPYDKVEELEHVEK